jgi:iron complex outermembrane recepter protein
MMHLRIFLLAASLLSLEIYAQTTASELAEGPSSSPAPSERIERLEVTGSYIQRIDIEGPSPLETIDREEFDKSGAINLSEILKLNPSFEAVFEGPGHVRFRGQHAGNVLILLNGMRLPKLNGGYYTSINGLPTSVIERVEVLKDGGSALYGSDAMSGVMNFRTRRDYDGAEVTTSTTLSDSGNGTQTSTSAAFGRSHGRGNVMGTIQVETSRPYGELDVGSFNRSENFTQVSTSNARLGSNVRIGPTCPNGQICDTDPLMYNESRPKGQDITALVTSSYEFTEVDVNVLAMFNRRETTSTGAPLRLGWTDDRGAGGANNAIAVGDMAPSAFRDRIVNDGLADANNFISLSGTFVDELGQRVSEQTDDSLNIQTDVKGYTSTSWIWNAQAGFATLKSRREIVTGEANQNVLREIFKEGRWDPTLPAGQKSNLSEAFLRPTYRNDGEMITGKVVLTGELFDLGNLYEAGGMVSMAIGAETQWESFAFDNDEELLNGTALSSSTRNYSGSRNVQSAFMELGAYPLHNLELQLAHRFDHYSDVGNTYNPKFALAYTPRKEVLLRSSIGTGFRAPGITDLYAGSQDSQQRFRDQASCDPSSTCASRFYDVTTYTDSNLKSETSLHYSVGSVVQPNRNVSVSVDQWNFIGKNTLSAIRAEEFTDVERRFGAGFLDSIGVTTTRDTDGNLLKIEHPGVMNMGRRELRGLDAGVDTRFDLAKESSWRLHFSAMHSLIFTRNTKKFDFDDEEKAESSWKNRLTVGLSNPRHFARVTALTVSSGMVGVGLAEERLPQYTEYDFSYSYSAFWGGKFNFAVRNLANTRPPTRTGGDLVTFASLDRNYSSFSPLRRRFFLGYSQTF